MQYRRVNDQFVEEILIDPTKWETEGLDPAKGIMLMGNPGVGKTYFMEQFARKNCKICWGHPLMPISQGISDGSAISIRRSCSVDPHFVNRFVDHDLFLDDLGSENSGQIVKYGEASDPIHDLLLIRYSVRNRFKTYITTNHTMEQIESRYGIRISDRLHEMCNILIYEGESKRK